MIFSKAPSVTFVRLVRLVRLVRFRSFLVALDFAVLGFFLLVFLDSVSSVDEPESSVSASSFLVEWLSELLSGLTGLGFVGFCWVLLTSVIQAYRVYFFEDNHAPFW